jgi:hypothetical protein
VSFTDTNRTRRRPLLWLGAAVLLWLAAAAIDRRTVVVIDNLGDHLRFAVAGTELVVPGAIARVDAITLWMADSIDPPGVLHWRVSHGGETTELTAPRRFDRSRSDPAPVGDWWVDDRCRPRAVAEHDVEIDGAFDIRLVVRGRSTNELSLSLEGDPTLHFSLRHGLKDNYLAIRDVNGDLVDVTTLDPTPWADLGAIAAQLGRVLAAAGLIIAFVGLTAAVSAGVGVAPAVPRGEPARRAAVVGAVVLAAIAAALSAWVAIDVLDGLPHQIDGVVYLLQARWLLDGELAPAVTTIQEHLRIPFTYVVDGRWVGHYPVGWPALLAVGLVVGVPHLVAPLFGAVAVLLVFFIGREIDGELTGLAAATLTLASPLIRLLSGSFFPHIACTVCVLLALWLLLVARRRSGWWLGAGAGAAMGCCLAIRPMTAVAVSVVLGVWLLVDAAQSESSNQRWTTLVAAILGGLAASIPTLVHNAVVTGRPLALPSTLADGAMYAPSLVPFGLRNLDAILASLSASLFGWGWGVFAGGLVLAVPLAFVAMPWLLRRARREDLLLLAMVAVVALGHLPTRAHGLHGYGARYAVDVAPCLVLLTARGFRELARWARPSTTAVATVVALFAVLTLSALASLPHRLALFRGYYGVTGELERQIEAQGIERAVILIDERRWQPWGEGARIMTGAQRFDIVIAADTGDTSVIERAYPERPVFRWNQATRTLDQRGGS